MHLEERSHKCKGMGGKDKLNGVKLLYSRMNDGEVFEVSEAREKGKIKSAYQ